jgi:hypothetical protein
MLALLSVIMQDENDSVFRASMYQPSPPQKHKSTLRVSEVSKRKSKNKASKKARKQNRK